MIACSYTPICVSVVGGAVGWTVFALLWAVALGGSDISLLLNYCKRFYDRQFLIRKVENVDMLQHFSSVLEDYWHPSNP
ncbi:MAG: hypothetical protein ACI37U_05535 [Bacteroides sp.]